MIRNWGIRNRVLLLALLPVISLGLALGVYLIRVRVQDLRASQMILGHALAEQLAPASEYGVFSNNPHILRALVTAAIREPNVEAVIIADRSGHLLAQATRPIIPAHGIINDVTRRIGSETGFKGLLVFSYPIMLQSVSTGEFGELLGEQSKKPAISAGMHLVLGTVTVKLSEESLAERQAQIIVNSGIILLVCLALSILLALAISGSVAAPIGRVIAMVKRFSAGEYDARVPLRSGGEIGLLEHGINDMAANAQRTQHELQEQVEQATVELRETLEEMEIKTVELDLARKRALAASRAKSEFLANMSHEIRTPMNAVLGFGDLLAKTSLDQGQRSYLATILRSAHVLLALLDDVLHAARLETGTPDIQLHSFLLHDLLEEIIQITAIEAYAKNIEFVLHIQNNLGYPLLGDRVKLGRALSNLVINAIKFTDAGSVVISSRSEPLEQGSIQVHIHVADTGIGIHEQDRRKLFEPFAQIDGSSRRRHGGTGLGLYITKKLVEQMGGTLTLTSTPTHGSEFHLSLPFQLDQETSPTPGVIAKHAGAQRSLLVYEPHPQAAVALLDRLRRLGWKTRPVDSLSRLREELRAENLHDIHAAAVLSLGYAELQAPESLDNLFADTAGGFPRLTLVSSLSAEVQADISARTGGPCLPKSINETVLTEQIEQLFENIPGADGTAAVSVNTDMEGLCVVVADDNRINRLLSRMLLEKHGATVLEAETGQQLMELLTAGTVDLILLDMHMPGEDGWQVAKRLKNSRPQAASIPVIALSAMDNDGSAAALAGYGLAGWLVKPLDEVLLTEMILKHAHRHVTTGPENSPVQDTDAALDRVIADLRPSIRQMLMEDLPEQWQAIKGAWQAHNLPQLQQLVHKLNGSAAFCRLDVLRALCARTEHSLGDGDHTVFSGLLPQMSAEVQLILEKLAAAIKPAPRS